MVEEVEVADGVTPVAVGRVYLVANCVNGRGYVGQTVLPLQRRWVQHQYPASGCRLLAYAIKKYGADAFELRELEVCPRPMLNEREKYWIAFLGTLAPAGYNILDGGDQPLEMRERKSEGRRRMLAEQAARGKPKGPTPLTESDVRSIFRLFDDGATVSALAIRFQVDQSTISHILRGSTWSHLNLTPARPMARRHVTREEVELVFRLNHEGLTDAEVSRKTNLSPSTVWRVLKTGARRSRLLSVEVKAEILRLRGTGLSFPKIGTALGINASTAWKVCRKNGVA